MKACFLTLWLKWPRHTMFASVQGCGLLGRFHVLLHCLPVLYHQPISFCQLEDPHGCPHTGLPDELPSKAAAAAFRNVWVPSVILPKMVHGKARGCCERNIRMNGWQGSIPYSLTTSNKSHSQDSFHNEKWEIIVSPACFSVLRNVREMLLAKWSRLLVSTGNSFQEEAQVPYVKWHGIYI